MECVDHKVNIMIEHLQLDYTQENTIIAIRSLKDNTVLKLVKPGEPYQFPEGYDYENTEFFTISIPPQIYSEINPNKTFKTSECECGEILYKTDVCCSEKGMGFAGKYVCGKCKKTYYTKKK